MIRLAKVTATLALIGETKRKKAAQGALERKLKGALKRLGTHNIGFPGGNIDLPIYAAGEQELWVAFGGPTENAAVRRYWNAFGAYEPDRYAQSIIVEINIPIDSNGGRVAGFFAEDVEMATSSRCTAEGSAAGAPVSASSHSLSAEADLFLVIDA